MSGFMNNERCPRDVSQFSGASTSEHVGPGHNDSTTSAGSFISEWENVQQRSQGLVKRFYQEKPVSDVDCYRGPGSYEQFSGTLQGGGGSATDAVSAVEAAMDLSRSSFRSRGARISPMITCPGSSEFLPSTSSQNPGPGHYEASRDLRGPQTRRAASMVSEPTESIAYEDVVWPGPAAYTPGVPTMPEAPSWDWHRTKSKQRGLFEVPTSPGPGEYKDMHVASDDWGLDGPNSAFDSGTLRPEVDTPFDFACRLRPNSVPGPGEYQQESQMGSLDAGAASGFKSGTLRTIIQGAELPGPGTYEQPKSCLGGDPRRSRGDGAAVDHNGRIGRKYHGITDPKQLVFLRETDGVQLTGFHATDLRPVLSDLPLEAHTDPGQYDPDLSLDEKLKKWGLVGKNGQFGPTANRFPPKKLEFDIHPGEYQQVEVKPSSPIRQDAKPFGFGTNRNPHSQSDSALAARMWGFQAIAHPDNAAIPGAGTYEDIVLSKAEYRSKLAHPRTQHVSFGSRLNKDRFGAGSEASIGPGQYDPQAAVSRGSGGAAHAASLRSNIELVTATEDLGPAAYDVQPRWLRKSFNVSHPTHAKVSLAARSASIAAFAAAAAPTRRAAIADVTQRGAPEGGAPDLPQHHAEMMRALERRSATVGGSRETRGRRRPFPNW